MTSIVIQKGADGTWCGVSEEDQRRWARWLARSASAQAGDTLRFEWKQPRSSKHHRLFFAQLGALAQRQEQFDTVEKLRLWLTVGAGYCDFAPGPTGRMVAIPRSIAWESMDEGAFGELHAAVNSFLWSEHARRFLWPHLTPQQTYDMVDQLLTEFSA